MKSGYSEGEAFDPIPRIDLSAILKEKSSDYSELVEEFGRVFSTIGFAANRPGYSHVRYPTLLVDLTD